MKYEYMLCNNTIKQHTSIVIPILISVIMFCCGSKVNEKGISNRTTNELKYLEDKHKLGNNLVNRIMGSNKSDKYWAKAINADDYGLKELDDCTPDFQEKQYLKTIFCRNNPLLSLQAMEKLDKAGLKERNLKLYNFILNNYWWGDEEWSRVLSCDYEDFCHRIKLPATLEDYKNLVSIFNPIWSKTKECKNIFGSDFSKTNLENIAKTNRFALTQAIVAAKKGFIIDLNILEYILEQYKYLNYSSTLEDWISINGNSVDKLIPDNKLIESWLNYKDISLQNGFKGIFVYHVKESLGILLRLHGILSNKTNSHSEKEKVEKLINENFFDLASHSSALFAEKNEKHLIRDAKKNRLQLKNILLDIEKKNLEKLSNSYNITEIKQISTLEFKYKFKQISLTPKKHDENKPTIIIACTDYDKKEEYKPLNFCYSALNYKFIELCKDYNVYSYVVAGAQSSTGVLSFDDFIENQKSKDNFADYMVLAGHGSRFTMSFDSPEKEEYDSHKKLIACKIKRNKNEFTTNLLKPLKPNGVLFLNSCLTGQKIPKKECIAQAFSYHLPYNNNEVRAPKIKSQGGYSNIFQMRPNIPYNVFPKVNLD